MLLGDLGALMLALWFVTWLRVGVLHLPPHPHWDMFMLLLWPLGALSRRLLPSWGLGTPEELRLTVTLLALLFTARGLAVDLVEGGSWAELPAHLLGFLAAAVLIPLARSLTKHLLLHFKAWGLPAVVYGDATTSRMLVETLKTNPSFGYLPVGVFDDGAFSQEREILGVPVWGGRRDVTPSAPLAIVALPGLSRSELITLLEQLLRSYRRVVIVPDLFGVQSLWAQTRDLGGVLGLELSRNLSDPLARATKRALDVLAVGLTSVVWVPVCLLLGLLIWLEDRASPLFLQERVGEGERPFRTWKFRTMLPNAEEVLQRKLAEDPALREEWEAHFKLRRDPRITRIGALLRKTSLDELPQLVNVLRGEMSLVGPRPLPAYHEQKLPQLVRDLRWAARPGMTGLWQVSGRSDSGTAGMERWDAYYVRNWSVWLDLVILMRTVRVVLLGSGAY
ncbi:exopolysaccharide biosynthesis polyprenyl glycosylphosphotransferase [Deinococcus aetherius]|nr:exopolysaccharide biosynthesis polyprenyl glycosylphosphotransferase [Deinococcus aetherius]